MRLKHLSQCRLENAICLNKSAERVTIRLLDEQKVEKNAFIEFPTFFLAPSSGLTIEIIILKLLRNFRGVSSPDLAADQATKLGSTFILQIILTFKPLFAHFSAHQSLMNEFYLTLLFLDLKYIVFHIYLHLEYQYIIV